MPELRHLRAFVVVAEELNFTRAARRLHIVQPALSAQVRQLEQELGVRLLRRSTRQVELTHAGHLLLERGRELLSSSEDLWSATRRAGEGELGRLALAYSPSTSYETAPRVVEVFRSRYPGVELETRLVPTPEVVRAVGAGSADVGIGRQPLTTSELVAVPLRMERLGVRSAPSHPLARLEAVRVGDLRGVPIAMHEREANPGHYDALRSLCREAGFEPTLAPRSLTFDPAERLIREARAVSIAGESSRPRGDAGICWLPFADRVPPFEVMLLMARHRHNPVARRFADLAVETAARLGWRRGLDES